MAGGKSPAAFIRCSANCSTSSVTTGGGFRVPGSSREKYFVMKAFAAAGSKSPTTIPTRLPGR